jgi:hypothetical protein
MRVEGPIERSIRTGRFLSVDPVLDLKRVLGTPQRWNRYSYVVNSPINRIDPDGRDDGMYGAQLIADCQLNNCRPNYAQDEADAKSLVSMTISFIPGVGDAIDALSAIRGRDLFTDEKLGTLSRVAGVLLPLVGTGAIHRISSLIHADNALVKFAEAAGKSNQRSLDHLVAELGRGNLNPGIGTKNVFGKVFEARARDGARVYFRQGEHGVEILAKSNKANQEQVIRKLRDLYD